jgi:hypothetical protein
MGERGRRGLACSGQLVRQIRESRDEERLIHGKSQSRSCGSDVELCILPTSQITSAKNSIWETTQLSKLRNVDM